MRSLRASVAVSTSLRASVVVLNPSVDVFYAVPSLRASVTVLPILQAFATVLNPRVGVLYAVPIAAVDYVDLVVNAKLDTSGRYKYIQEAIAVVDGTAFVLSRQTADVLYVDDSKTISTTKDLTDSVEMQDLLTTLLVYLRAFADGASVTDVDVRAYLLGKAEQIVVEDNDFIDSTKSLAHSITPADVSVFLTEKPFSESLSTADANALVFSPARVESLTMTDVGVVSIQDYCSLGYFAEDYVGSSQSF